MLLARVERSYPEQHCYESTVLYHSKRQAVVATMTVASSKNQGASSSSSLGSGMLEEDDSVTYIPTAPEKPTGNVNRKRLTTETSTMSTVSAESNSSSSSQSNNGGTGSGKVDFIEQTNNDCQNVDWENISVDDLLGGEPSLLDRGVEMQGVKDILKALTLAQKGQLSDIRMPVRHFRAENGNTSKAIEKLAAALQWREEFQVSRLVQCLNKNGDNTSPLLDSDGNDVDSEFRDMMILENATGKVYVRGYNKEGRSLIYMYNDRNNTNHELNNMRHLCWNIEKAIACTRRKSREIGGNDCDDGKKKLPLDKHCLIMDMSNFSMRSAPPLSTSKFTLDILQKHYPERIYRIYVCHAPFAFRMFWNLVKPFIDPITKEKVVMVTEGNDGMKQLHDEVGSLEQLEPCVRGKENPVPPNFKEFDSQEYLDLPMNVSFGEIS